MHTALQGTPRHAAGEPGEGAGGQSPKRSTLGFGLELLPCLNLLNT